MGQGDLATTKKLQKIILYGLPSVGVMSCARYETQQKQE